ncbi:uncharacterized protein F4812DRAFT_457619 [Daldinia caldariorum]|uniref:uncharacterized protein n=1 Tax=Daldinia caldariorum TaxID=326644 RepID=UPI002007864C|nr:uncharacterized protein F4812DRAFT_457619 [Daldinia caldariorum]KAI1469074.1 hypothetical protein F4812DRAFT_457619 [Daldinia caldariorum]
MASSLENVDATVQRMTLDTSLTCSHNPNAPTPCKNVGSLACKDCLLVSYCSKSCQKAHWPIHRKDCKSMNNWEPSWIKEHRMPSFLSYNFANQFHKVQEVLWGRVPAIDVVQLEQNEGRDYQKPLDLLFAASGDMRNAILSVANLPEHYKGPLRIVLEDKQMPIVARNLIFLMTFLVEDNPSLAAEHVLHIWYSALITESCRSLLQDKLRPMIQDVCNQIMHKSSSSLLSKTWLFGNVSVRLILCRDNWFSLLSYLDVPKGLTIEAAQCIRRGTMLAPQSVDDRDRALSLKVPCVRIGTLRFRADGILLPFSSSREEFTIPNPTLFASTGQWPIMDTCDPTLGWLPNSFLELDIGPTTNDIYGKLHYYLRQLFMDFHRRLRVLPVKFDLLQVDVESLRFRLDEERFDRIDASNLADVCYLGIDETLKAFSPLIERKTVNPHATLITLFSEAIFDIQVLKQVGILPLDNPEEQLVKVLRFKSEFRPPNALNVINVVMAAPLVQDMNKDFQTYMAINKFELVALQYGLQMKDTHTIINPWPMKIDDEDEPTEKAKEYFSQLLSSGHTGQERYVEWKRD